MAKGKGKSKKLGLEINKGDYIILIMGPTGVGKSSLVNKLCDANVVEVGETLESCTAELKPVEIPLDLIQQHLHFWGSPPPAKLIIVDTPGFDDTNTDEYEILRRIATWLAELYRVGARQTGVIYLQGIDDRVTEATRRGFEVFDRLCGPGACKSVALGTTKWGNVIPERRGAIETKERQLRDEFWKDMIARGSTVHRVDDKATNASPWNLVRAILQIGDSEPPVLQIQRELVEMRKMLLETEAASILSKRRLEKLGKSMKTTGATNEKVRAVGDFRGSQGKSIILVMGAVGAGKSTFVNQLLGEEVARVDHGLGPSTLDLQAINVPLDLIKEHLPQWCAAHPENQEVVIVDTPGLDDTTDDDRKILKQIVHWLAKTYGAKTNVAGIIYLHEITETRWSGSRRGNFDAFMKLCGNNSCRSVVLGTTKWGNIPSNSIERMWARQDELRDKYWKEMTARGSTVQRVDETTHSGWSLVRTVLDQDRTSHPQIRVGSVELLRKWFSIRL